MANGIIKGLTDYFLENFDDISIDKAKDFFKAYGPKNISENDFVKSLQTRIAGRGNTPQGSGSFSNLPNTGMSGKASGLTRDEINQIIQDKARNAKFQPPATTGNTALVKPQSTAVVPTNVQGTSVMPSTGNTPNWTYYREYPTSTSLVPSQGTNVVPATSRSTSLVPVEGTQRGTQGSGYRRVEPQPQVQTEGAFKNNLTPQQKYDIDRAMGYRGVKPEMEYEGNLGKLKEGERLIVGSDKVAAGEKSAYNAIRSVENFNPKEEAKLLSGMGKDAVIKGIDDIAKGVYNSPTAQQILRVMNSPEGQTVLKGMKLGGKVLAPLFRVGMKVLGPVGWAFTAKDIFDLGTAGVNYKKAQDDLKSVEEAKKYADALVAQGYDKVTAHQIANGLPIKPIQGVEQRIPEREEVPMASTQRPKETMKEKMAREKAEDAQNLPSASGGIENLINRQIAKVGGYEPEVPATLPVMEGQGDGGTPMVASGQNIPMEQTIQQPVQNTPIQQSDLDLINAIQSGYVNQQDIYDRINQAQQRLYDTINQGDYRYRGDIVQPQNPYQADINRLQADQNAYRNRQNYDWLTGRTTAPDQRAMELENARQLYQAQLANQAGVPYEDYANAMADRQANQIKAQAQEAINQLQFMQNQTSDMKEKLAYAAKIRDIQQGSQDAIMKTLLENKRAIDVANINAGSAANVANINALSSQNVAQMNNTARILEEQMKLQDPVTQMKNISTTAMQLGYVPKETLMAFFNVNRDARLAMFGQDASPEQIAQTFNAIPQQQVNNLWVRLQSMFGGN